MEKLIIIFIFYFTIAVVVRLEFSDCPQSKPGRMPEGQGREYIYYCGQEMRKNNVFLKLRLINTHIFHNYT